MPNVIEVDGIVKRYGDLVALDQLSLEVQAGEIYGLLGPNGSGKSTAIYCMLALLTHERGEVRIFGQTMRPDSYDSKRRIGVVMQDVAVFGPLTVEENIDFFCGLYVRDRAERKRLVADAIDFAGLGDFRKFLPAKLSGGLLRRLNIACGIAHRPDLIFLDEPTVAVDPQSRNNILEGLEELNRQGTTIVYTTHYMEEVEQICDRIGILDHGQLIAEGTADELKGMISSGDTITIELQDPNDAVIQALRELDFVSQLESSEGRIEIQTKHGERRLDSVLATLAAHDTAYSSIYAQKPTLNTVFLEITGRALRDHD